MDNLSAHQVAGIKEAIEKTGARLFYLPPYSPDVSPIELAWSKIKNTLRTSAAVTPRRLHQAICHAFRSVSENNALACFKHRGYSHSSFSSMQ